MIAEGEHEPYTISWPDQNLQDWNLSYFEFGTFVYVISDAYGCSVEESLSIIPNGIVSKIPLNNWWVNGTQIIYCGNQLGFYLDIYDTEGKLVYTTLIQEKQNTLPDLPTGIYFLRANGKTQSTHFNK